MIMAKPKIQIDKLDQELDKAREAVNHSKMALDAAVDLLADGGDHKRVDAARRDYEAACDKYSALSRKRDRLEDELFRRRTAAERKAKTERLAELLKNHEAATLRRLAIVDALKFEGGNRDERLRAMHAENDRQSAIAHQSETEAMQIAGELGEDVSEKIQAVKVSSATTDAVRAALLDFGVTDRWARRDIEHAREHGRVPMQI
jgi:hypothetical protein